MEAAPLGPIDLGVDGWEQERQELGEVMLQRLLPRAVVVAFGRSGWRVGGFAGHRASVAQASEYPQTPAQQGTQEPLRRGPRRWMGKSAMGRTSERNSINCHRNSPRHRNSLPVPRAPSPEGRCDHHSARDCHPCRQALPRLSRSYGLMRPTSILSRPRFYPCTLSLCRLLRAPAARRPFPASSPRIFPQVPGPLPRSPLWCTCSFLPTGHRPSPFLTGPEPHKIPHNDFRTGLGFRGCSHSLMFRPQVCSPPRSFPPPGWPLDPPRAAVTFTSTQNSVRYLPEQWIC